MNTTTKLFVAQTYLREQSHFLSHAADVAKGSLDNLEIFPQQWDS